jgi:hypothetical protein
MSGGCTTTFIRKKKTKGNEINIIPLLYKVGLTNSSGAK